MRKLIVYFQLPFRRKCTLIEAMVMLTFVKAMSLVLPFRVLSRLFGKQGISCTTTKAPTTQQLQEIRWAMRVAGKQLPWGGKCLTQAIAGKLMAKYRGHKTTIYIGVALTKDDDFAYHAWLRHQDFIICGGDTDRTHKVLSSFH